MIDVTDMQYEETTITKVESSSDGHSITRSDGWSLFAPAYHGTPKVGDVLRVYGRGIGYPFRGLMIDGVEVFYRTEAEDEAKHEADMRQREDDKRAEFEKKRPQMDESYSRLPPEFQRRLDRFRNGNPDFRWEFEGYELFCCEDAVVIATALKTGEAIRQFSAAKNDKQKELAPAVRFDSHSGNTFGMACRLAMLYIERPDLVEKEHGAMVPLVGCKEYGCTH